MRIAEVRAWSQAVALKRPYTIATRTIDSVELFYVELRDDAGRVGLGSASPAPGVTGETREACGEALADDRLRWLVGVDPRHLGAHTRRVGDGMAATPAARAAVDMALWDLFGRVLDTPVVDLLGARRREPLPTSITVGIKSTEEALAETREYLDLGFRCLKIKVGLDLEGDIDRLTQLRRLAGPDVLIRVDGNQGYTFDDYQRFVDAAAALHLELVEQPLPRGEEAALRRLPGSLRRSIAADESLHGETDALGLVEPPAACGIFNIKLMKCGGITPARGIATIAEAAGVELMWGCMDESVISIAAALHAAYACPTTRYLDLDGSFDLARDLAAGGFVLDGGRLLIPEAPGLGVTLQPS